MNSENAKNNECCSRWFSAFAVTGCLLIAFALSVKFDFRNLPLGSKKTIDSVVEMYGEDAHKRMAPAFKKAKVDYPPTQLVMVGLKEEKKLEIYAADKEGNLKYVCSYPIIGNSGVLGPKLKEGDKQMPEGIYRIQELEPNSTYHVALRVNYPNDFDKQKGAEEGREQLGGDIMIHGYNKSIGCLAMGDPVSEELFVLVHDVGLDKTELLMCPFDFRLPPDGVALPDKPEWISEVYGQLKTRVKSLPSS